MIGYHSRRSRRKSDGACPPASLPLFMWAADRFASDPSPTQPRAALVIARRHRLPPNLARLVAELAGFRLEA